MVSRKTSPKASLQRHRRIVKEIEKKFGKVIDLERTPFVLVEIVREFGHRLVEEGSSGTGGVSPGVSTVAVGVTPPPPPPPADAIENTFLVKAILTMQRDVKALNKKLDRLGAAK